MQGLGEAQAAAFEESLRPYQQEGVSFLVRSESALLADEMGLGKTVQAAFALRLVLRSPLVNRALVVVPSSLAYNWQRELERWAPELTVRRLVGAQRDRTAYYDLPVPVLIATYEQIGADALDRIPDGAFDIVVLDEAQRIKNHSSRTALACRLLPRKIAWALSGTPIENSRSDLESIFDFLRPNLIRPTDGRARILAAIAPFFLRRKKSEVVAEMPPIIYQDLLLELNSGQRRSYHAAWASGTDELRHLPRPVSSTALLALITKLKQICNFDPDTGDSCKLDALQLLFEEALSSGTKVLLFSQYVRTLKWIADRLPEVRTCLYTGEQSQEEKEKVLSEYAQSPGPQVLLASLRAGGVGLNIPQSDLVVLFDRWWNPAVEAQAVNRAHRLGRQTPLHVVRFLVRDTVEERIGSILTSKQLLFEDYVEAVETDEVRLLSRNDLIHALDVSHFDIDADTTIAALK
jgi:SNF2 family DNA or RNA helicase